MIMHPQSTYRLLLTLALLLTASAASAQIFRRSEFLITGVVDGFPSRSGEVTVRGRDGQTYKLFLRDARVDLGPEGNGTWEELRPGALVDIYGSFRGAREIDAILIRVVGRESGAPPREAIREWAEGSRHEVSGRVVALDRDRESLRLRTGDGTVPVELFDRTRFRTGRGTPARFRDLREGATVRVRGEAHSGRLVADEVFLLRGGTAPPEREPRREQGSVVVLEGMVRSPLRFPERTIALRTEGGNFDVAVPRDVPVLWQSRRILLHALKPGDRVHIRGHRDRDGRLIAERVTVLARVESRGGAAPRVADRPRRGDAVRLLVSGRTGVWMARRVEIR
jgi:hypothetical protein